MNPRITRQVLEQAVVFAPGFGVGMQVARVEVGPSGTNEVMVTATGTDTWNIPAAAGYGLPGYVFLQARQSDDVDHDFPDAFALQVISTTVACPNDARVMFLVKRLDGNPPGGWGQDLHVNILLAARNIVPA
jgi:hypothetical protein